MQPPLWQASARSSALSVACRLAGGALAVTFGTVAAVRHNRPLHPEGVVYDATVDRLGASTGVPWLDRAGSSEVIVRVSRATGLPPGLPDIYGMALRVPLDGSGAGSEPGAEASGAHADLLFASTGHTAYGRFVLRLRRSAGTGPLTTLLPLCAPLGPLILRLAPLGPNSQGTFAVPQRMSLSYAVGTGGWVELGTLSFGERRPDLRADRYDPLRNELPGTGQYRLVRLLREPSYRAARRVWPGSVA